MNIPREAIVAAGRALHEESIYYGIHDEDMAYEDARTVLEAAAPLLMAQAWNEGTRAQAEWHHAERRAASRFQAIPPALINPYRP